MTSFSELANGVEELHDAYLDLMKLNRELRIALNAAENKRDDSYQIIEELEAFKNYALGVYPDLQTGHNVATLMESKS